MIVSQSVASKPLNHLSAGIKTACGPWWQGPRHELEATRSSGFKPRALAASRSNLHNSDELWEVSHDSRLSAPRALAHTNKMLLGLVMIGETLLVV